MTDLEDAKIRLKEIEVNLECIRIVASLVIAEKSKSVNPTWPTSAAILRDAQIMLDWVTRK